jgi:MFS family permease
MQQKSLSSNIWKFYAITALGIRFIAPIRIIYLISFGLTFAQIGMMELAAAIAIIILEIPSGIFADIVGRKKSRMIAYTLSIIAFSCLSFGSTLPIFIFGWVLSGAADAFQSGAQDALIFDTLKQLNREKDYIKVKSHFIFINAISVIVGSLVGAYLYTINHRLPWYLITMTIILSTFIFITVKEPEFSARYAKISDQLKEFKRSLTTSLSNFEVGRLILFGLILMIPMYIFTTLLNQPYLISRGFSVQSLGVIFAIITGVGGIVASFSHKIEPFLKQRFSFLLIIVSMTFFLVSMGLIHNPAILLLVVGFYIIDNFKTAIIDNYLNEVISSESRATVLSVQSFVNNIFISVLFVFIGYLVDIFSIDVVLISVGVFVSLLCIPLWFVTKPKEISITV